LAGTVTDPGQGKPPLRRAAVPARLIGEVMLTVER
jgi:hypothetical protein